MSCNNEAKRRVLNRLARAEGQLKAVRRAIEGDANCREVVQQLAAVSKAIDRAGFVVIAEAMKGCSKEDGSDISMEELERIFLSLA